MLNLEKDVPLPLDGRTHRSQKDAHVFAAMNLGDSFAVSLAERAKYSVLLSKHKKAHPEFNYVGRKMDDSVRFWRIAPEDEIA